MKRVEEVSERGKVGFMMREEDGEADGEDVHGLLEGCWVGVGRGRADLRGRAGGDESFTELPQGRQEEL